MPDNTSEIDSPATRYWRGQAEKAKARINDLEIALDGGLARQEKLEAEIDRQRKELDAAHRRSVEDTEEIERLRAEVVRQAHLIVELGAKLQVATGQSVEQFERNELGGRTLNEFLSGK